SARRRGRRCRGPPAAVHLPSGADESSRSYGFGEVNRRLLALVVCVLQRRGGDDRADERDARRDVERVMGAAHERERLRIARRPPEATTAPRSATRADPPPCPMLFSTAEPPPALSGRTDAIAAAVTGAIAADMPRPPSSIPGSSIQNDSCAPICENQKSDPAS